MLRGVPSIRLKMMLIVVATSVAALLFAGVVLVAYDVNTYRAAWGRDLMIQAEMVGRASAPAIVFGDTLTAHQNLEMLAIRPDVLAAAVYTRQGDIFARYARTPGADAEFPAPEPTEGYRIRGDRLVLFKSIDDADGRVGTVYLRAHYDLNGRLAKYLPVLAGILIASLLVALIMSSGLQSAVTKPVLAIAEVAHDVRARRDYSLRVHKETQDETGQLVDAFNAMLEEVADAQRSLLDSNQRKDEFLATLAHELRNPLGPIRNAAQYLRMKSADPASRPSLELIDRQVEHMVRLIEDLLDISRINRDALELRYSDFTVGDLVHDVVEATQYAVEESGQEMRVQVEDAAVSVHADRARLVQIVCNLVNNAIKYTARGGRLDLRVSSERHDLHIEIADTGIGIEPDKIEHIFAPFSQVDRSLEKTRGGLGIGLALSQRLALLHGGMVTATSEGLGKGSTFHVKLPIVNDEPGKVALAIPSRRLEEGRLRILVADDNVDGAQSLDLLLSALGHQVTVAHDGVEAFERLESGDFDVAVLDIGMPRMNGYDLARRIREQAWGHAMLLVALTGWGQAEDKKKAFEAGFDHHLTKPIHPELLLGAIARKSGDSHEPGARSASGA